MRRRSLLQTTRRLLLIPLTLLWAFAAVACGDEPAAPADQAPQDARVARILGLRGVADDAQGLYAVECAPCHMESGRGAAGGGRGKDLTQWLGRHEDAAAIDAILYGRAGMLAYGDQLRDQEVADLVAYLRARFDR